MREGTSPSRLVTTSAELIGLASVRAAVIEPGWEYRIDLPQSDWAFGPLRLTAQCGVLRSAF